MPKTNAAAASNVITVDAPKINWGKPDLSILTSGPTDRPVFPVALLGEFWGPFAIALAKSKNAPVDYVGASLITVAAALMGNSRVAVGPAWREPSVIWTALVGSSSSGKSPALDPFIEMVVQLESEAASDPEDDDEEDVTFHIDDVTAEATALLASKNPRGLLLLKDELLQWFKGVGRHEGFWNSAYGARVGKVLRKTKPPIRIKRLAISILGNAQPKTLTKHIQSPENTGFTARWLYVYPAPVDGYRAAPAVSLVPATAKLRKLWNLMEGCDQPVEIPLGAPAVAKFERWVDEKRQAAAEDHGGVWGQWLGKQGGMALRLALVIEHLWWAGNARAETAPPTRISVPALNAAMQFIDLYSAPMAALTLGDAIRPPSEQNALHLVQIVTERKLSSFNARALGRAAGAGPLSDPKIMDQACAVLAEASLIRHVKERADGRPGRPPLLYKVNPVLLRATAPTTIRRGVRA